MKHLLILFISLLSLVSCSKDDSNSPVEPGNSTQNNNVYYVKYEVNMFVPSRFKQVINYTTEKGEKTTSTTSSTWEGTYGPFKKGQTVSLTATPTATSSLVSTNYVRIYVSCNNSPFGIKSENTSDKNDGLSTKYTLQ
ncbi:hypothetical protein [Prevotella pectinovora]|uniref:hypothetical protein n=1 Tax=Prevotella pectinovora TaxID=1602169 RepID=UPI003A8F2453